MSQQMKVSLFNLWSPVKLLLHPHISYLLYFPPQHKGFCKASLYNLPTGDENISVECEIYEPEVRLKSRHNYGSHGIKSEK